MDIEQILIDSSKIANEAYPGFCQLDKSLDFLVRLQDIKANIHKAAESLHELNTIDIDTASNSRRLKRALGPICFAVYTSANFYPKLYSIIPCNKEINL